MNFDLKFYYLLVWRRMPVMLVIFTLCAGIGVAMAMTLPPRFASNATLLVERARIPGELAESTVRIDANQQLQVIRQRLMTRANLLEVAEKYQVFASEPGMSADDIVQAMRSQTSIAQSGGRNQATIMVIGFESGTARLSADVVNEFVTLVLTEDAEIRTGGSQQTLAFFAQQVQRYNDQLTKQSSEIVAFKEANKEALPEGLQYRLNRQSTLQERMNLRARDLASLNDQRDRLVEIGAAAIQQRAPLTPEQEQLAGFKAQLAEWESVLSGENPKVRVLRAKITELEKRMEADGNGGPVNTESLLELQLAQIDADIDFTRQEIKDTELELSELRKAIEATPAVAIRLDELEREYDNTQSLYNQAVADRAAAQTGEQIEVNKQGERVTLIDPAVAPSAPTSPNRKLVAGGGVFAGAGLAGVFFILTELLNRSIRRPVDLSRALGVQPLATIPYLEEVSVRRRRRVFKAIFVGSVVMAIPIGLWAIHTLYLPLDLVIEQVLDRVGL